MSFLETLGGIISGGAEILGKEMDRHKARTERIRDKHYKSGSGNVNRNSSNAGTGKHRGTKEEFRSDHTGMKRRPGSYSIEKRAPLSRACNIAPREPRVYILYLDGQVMKCGVATYSQGLQWRFT